MTRTFFSGISNVGDGTVLRGDLNTTLAGSAVITRVLAGTGVTLSSTGVDVGTGDVTINATGGISYGFNRRYNDMNNGGFL